MVPKLGILLKLATFTSLISGCAQSVSEGEIQSFASAVQVSTEAIEPTLQARETRETQEIENQRFQAGQRVVALTPECEAIDLEIVSRDCQLMRLGLDDSANVGGRDARRYMTLIDEYVSALALLARADTQREISSAIGVLQSSVIELSGNTQSTRLSRFATSLEASGDATSRLAGFFANSAKRHAIRNLVLAADPEIAVLSAAIEQVLYEELGQNTVLLYQSLIASERAAIEARSISEAAHRQAVQEFEVAYSAYMQAVNAPLPAAIRKVASSHAALSARVTGPATSQETINFLKELQDLIAATNTLKEAF